MTHLKTLSQIWHQEYVRKYKQLQPDLELILASGVSGRLCAP